MCPKRRQIPNLYKSLWEQQQVGVDRMGINTMSNFSRTTRQLTHRGALAILSSCLKTAENLKCAVHIVIASRTGQILASLSMDDAYFLSAETARNKALTAASHRKWSDKIGGKGRGDKAELALASGGKITGMAGGVPIFLEGECIGGVGVGGANDEQDYHIASSGIVECGFMFYTPKNDTEVKKGRNE